MSLELPTACQNCTKTGMDAIACPILSEVPEESLFIINCGTAHYDKDSLTATGAKFLGSIHRNSKPPVINSAKGRAMASHSHSGAS